MHTSTSSTSFMMPNLTLLPSDEAAVLPPLNSTRQSHISSALGPLILSSEIAPVPGIVAGAMIVSSLIVLIIVIMTAKLRKNSYLVPVFKSVLLL